MKDSKKRLKLVGNDPKFCEDMIFDLLVAPEQRKMGGPKDRPWQGYSDVALIRVKESNKKKIMKVLKNGKNRHKIFAPSIPLP